MKIVIEFKTDNAAFEDDYDGEIKAIMKKVTNQVSDGYREGRIIDSNGNHVGYWTLQE